MKAPRKTIGQAWKSFWLQYFNISKRSTRSEFWWMILILVSIRACLMAICFAYDLIFKFIALTNHISDPRISQAKISIAYVIIYTIIIITPLTTLMIRRLKDTGFSRIIRIPLVITCSILEVVYISLQCLQSLGYFGEHQNAMMVLYGSMKLLEVVIFVVALMPSYEHNKNYKIPYRTIWQSYKLFWLQYFNVSRRSTRNEFWCPFLINISILIVVLNMVSNILLAWFGILLIPTFTLSVRRLIDIGFRKDLSIAIMVIDYLMLIIVSICNSLLLSEASLLMSIIILILNALPSLKQKMHYKYKMIR